MIDAKDLTARADGDRRGRHCWHAGQYGLSFPPEIREVCCHCGAVRVKRQGRPPGHGRHAPLAYDGQGWTYPPGVVLGVCPDAPDCAP